jgi:hypothetical protein
MIKEKMMNLTIFNTEKTFNVPLEAQEQPISSPLLQNLTSLAQKYHPCSLKNLGEKALMNRTDTKFVLPLNLGLQVLTEMQHHYQVLEIDGQRLQPYNTLYFDTPDFFFYREHLRSHANRFKLRLRTYLVNDVSFLEIKQHNNKGRTVKERIQLDSFRPVLDPEAFGWAVERLPEAAWPLAPVLNNRFYRMLLVNPDQAERITLDFDLQFNDYHHKVDAGPLVIAEVKRKSCHEESVFINWLHSAHQRSSSFSKYCLGLALLNPGLKRNRIKPNLLQLQKMQQVRYA